MSLRSATNQTLYFLSKYFVLLLSFLLLGFSVFFFVGAERFRRELRSKNSDLFHDGELVKIIEVIDGDEMRIENKKGESTILRILGIKVFDSSANAFLFPRYGEQCIKYIKETYKGRWGRLEFGKKKTDGQRRLLSILKFRKRGSDDYSADLGNDLVRQGFALVYLKYPFKFESQYLQTEKLAISRRKGLWENSAAKKMALSLKSLWKMERQ
jgi:endonuclease YncB( thermonuclease family)